MTGLATALPSYINRVYEFQTVEGTRLIAKFYRPGRWSREALQMNTISSRIAPRMRFR